MTSSSYCSITATADANHPDSSNLTPLSLNLGLNSEFCIGERSDTIQSLLALLLEHSADADHPDCHGLNVLCTKVAEPPPLDS